jgi:predicted DNA-binding transcriptional regulator AlpA
MTKKLQDAFAYPPRGMRRRRAAAYFDISERTFTTLVEEGKLPKPKRLRGMQIWDRIELDAFFDELSEHEPERRNTVDEILGIGNRDGLQ